jgi:hypothetical protein
VDGDFVGHFVETVHHVDLAVGLSINLVIIVVTLGIRASGDSHNKTLVRIVIANVVVSCGVRIFRSEHLTVSLEVIPGVESKTTITATIVTISITVNELLFRKFIKGSSTNTVARFN